MTMILIVVKLALGRILCIMTLMSHAPKATNEIRLQVILTEEQRDMLDELRRRDPKLPSRSDLVRSMIEEAYKIGGKGKK